MNLLLLLASLAFASEPPCYLRGLDSERDTACINETFRAFASGLQVLEKSSGTTVNAASGDFVVDGTLVVKGGIVYAFSGSSITFTGGSSGQPIKCVSSTTVGRQSYAATTAIPQDDTAPQSNEGQLIISTSITPSNASNALVIEANINCDAGAGARCFLTLFQDSNTDASATSFGPGQFTNIGMAYRMLAGTTSATSFAIRFGTASGGTIVLNGLGTNTMGNTIASSLRICEYGL